MRQLLPWEHQLPGSSQEAERISHQMFDRLPVFQRFPNPDLSDDGLEQSEPQR